MLVRYSTMHKGICIIILRGVCVWQHDLKGHPPVFAVSVFLTGEYSGNVFAEFQQYSGSNYSKQIFDHRIRNNIVH